MSYEKEVAEAAQTAERAYSQPALGFARVVAAYIKTRDEKEALADEFF